MARCCRQDHGQPAWRRSGSSLARESRSCYDMGMLMPRMSMPRMHMPLNIWLLNPYHSGSHQAWAEGYAAHSRHQVRILSMAGHFWKWRMQGGTLELAEQAT